MATGEPNDGRDRLPVILDVTLGPRLLDQRRHQRQLEHVVGSLGGVASLGGATLLDDPVALEPREGLHDGLGLHDPCREQIVDRFVVVILVILITAGLGGRRFADLVLFVRGLLRGLVRGLVRCLLILLAGEEIGEEILVADLLIFPTIGGRIRDRGGTGDRGHQRELDVLRLDPGKRERLPTLHRREPVTLVEADHFPEQEIGDLLLRFPALRAKLVRFERDHPSQTASKRLHGDPVTAQRARGSPQIENGLAIDDDDFTVVIAQQERLQTEPIGAGLHETLDDREVAILILPRGECESGSFLALAVWQSASPILFGHVFAPFLPVYDRPVRWRGFSREKPGLTRSRFRPPLKSGGDSPFTQRCPGFCHYPPISGGEDPQIVLAHSTQRNIREPMLRTRPQKSAAGRK